MIKKYLTNIIENKYWEEALINEEEVPKNIEWNVLRVYPEIKKQKWIGMGGALTGASCYNLSKLPKEKQDSLLKDYYTKSGLNYNLARVSIGSCDFNKESYSYATENDLKDFSLKQDYNYLIPTLLKIAKYQDLTILASPWSPPSFMKSNKSLLQGGKLEKKYYSLYADYLIKYLKEMQKENIKIKYLTIQNEPYATQTWESCNWTLNNQKEFIYDYLIPKLKAEKIKIEILVWDHNKDNLYNVTKGIYQEKSNFICGVAFHFYTGGHYQNLNLVHELYPELLLVHTEGCIGIQTDWNEGALFYAYDLINDINSGLNGYIDWNILLDYDGGPNHQENYCKSPIMLTKDEDDYCKSPIYYFIGHFSKFIKINDQVLYTDSYSPYIQITSFKSKDKIIVILLNVGPNDEEYNLIINSTIIKDKMSSQSIVTYELEM